MQKKIPCENARLEKESNLAMLIQGAVTKDKNILRTMYLAVP